MYYKSNITNMQWHCRIVCLDNFFHFSSSMPSAFSYYIATRSKQSEANSVDEMGGWFFLSFFLEMLHNTIIVQPYSQHMLLMDINI